MISVIASEAPPKCGAQRSNLSFRARSLRPGVYPERSRRGPRDDSARRIFAIV